MKREGGQGPLAKEGGVYLDICAGVLEVLVTPLLIGPVCLYLTRAGLKIQSTPGTRDIRQSGKINFDSETFATSLFHKQFQMCHWHNEDLYLNVQ